MSTTQYITLSEVAYCANLSRQQIHKLIRSGKGPPNKLPNANLYPLADVEIWCKSRLTSEQPLSVIEQNRRKHLRAMRAKTTVTTRLSLAEQLAIYAAVRAL